MALYIPSNYIEELKKVRKEFEHKRHKEGELKDDGFYKYFPVWKVSDNCGLLIIPEYVASGDYEDEKKELFNSDKEISKMKEEYNNPEYEKKLKEFEKGLKNKRKILEAKGMKEFMPLKFNMIESYLGLFKELAEAAFMEHLEKISKKVGNFKGFVSKGFKKVNTKEVNKKMIKEITYTYNISYVKAAELVEQVVLGGEGNFNKYIMKNNEEALSRKFYKSGSCSQDLGEFLDYTSIYEKDDIGKFEFIAEGKELTISEAAAALAVHFKTIFDEKYSVDAMFRFYRKEVIKTNSVATQTETAATPPAANKKPAATPPAAVATQPAAATGGQTTPAKKPVEQKQVTTEQQSAAAAKSIPTPPEKQLAAAKEVKSSNVLERYENEDDGLGEPIKMLKKTMEDGGLSNGNGNSLYLTLTAKWGTRWHLAAALCREVEKDKEKNEAEQLVRAVNGNGRVGLYLIWIFLVIIWLGQEGKDKSIKCGIVKRMNDCITDIIACLGISITIKTIDDVKKCLGMKPTTPAAEEVKENPKPEEAKAPEPEVDLSSYKTPEDLLELLLAKLNKEYERRRRSDLKTINAWIISITAVQQSDKWCIYSKLCDLTEEDYNEHKENLSEAIIAIPRIGRPLERLLESGEISQHKTMKRQIKNRCGTCKDYVKKALGSGKPAAGNAEAAESKAATAQPAGTVNSQEATAAAVNGDQLAQPTTGDKGQEAATAQPTETDNSKGTTDAAVTTEPAKTTSSQGAPAQSAGTVNSPVTPAAAVTAQPTGTANNQGTTEAAVTAAEPGKATDNQETTKAEEGTTQETAAKLVKAKEDIARFCEEAKLKEKLISARDGISDSIDDEDWRQLRALLDEFYNALEKNMNNNNGFKDDNAAQETANKFCGAVRKAREEVINQFCVRHYDLLKAILIFLEELRLLLNLLNMENSISTCLQTIANVMTKNGEISTGELEDLKKHVKINDEQSTTVTKKPKDGGNVVAKPSQPSAATEIDKKTRQGQPKATAEGEIAKPTTQHIRDKVNEVEKSSKKNMDISNVLEKVKTLGKMLEDKLRKPRVELEERKALRKFLNLIDDFIKEKSNLELSTFIHKLCNLVGEDGDVEKRHVIRSHKIRKGIREVFNEAVEATNNKSLINNLIKKEMNRCEDIISNKKNVGEKLHKSEISSDGSMQTVLLEAEAKLKESNAFIESQGQKKSS